MRQSLQATADMMLLKSQQQEQLHQQQQEQQQMSPSSSRSDDVTYNLPPPPPPQLPALPADVWDAPRHPQLTSSVRRITISWMAEVANELRFPNGVLVAAVSHLNIYLGLSDRDVPRSLIQLVAVACMALAGGRDEQDEELSARDWVSLTNDTYEEHDFDRMLCLLLRTLGHHVDAPTALEMLELTVTALYQRGAVMSPPMLHVASYFVDLSLLEVALLAHDPSHIACAALLLAQAVINSAAPAADAANAAAAMVGLLREVVPGVRMASVRFCVARLQAAVRFGHMEAHDLYVAPLREKYLSDAFSRAADLVAACYVPAVEEERRGNFELWQRDRLG